MFKEIIKHLNENENENESENENNNANDEELPSSNPILRRNN